MTTIQQINSKVSNLAVDTLKEMARLLVNDTRAEADTVLSATLDALMARMPEDQFVSFCEGLEA